VAFEPREKILGLKSRTRLGQSAALVGSLVRVASVRAARRLGLARSATAEPTVVEYESAPGEPLRAIVDSWGDPRSATAVVIPPAWGRTKETLLPLAATIVETFRSARQPVTVIRFDGSYRRGESFVPPDLRHPGAEYLRFTFSRAVRDIHATVEFLRDSPALRPARVVLVSFSLAAIESRRAVATDTSGLIQGWISVVGMVDLQSALKTISAGIDYAYGLSRGLRFGHHELVGVVSDMDHTGLDALEHRLVFLEDARRDMAKTRVPVTWIHGRHDAWMDLDRARHLMSCGDVANRRVIEVPTGHQLRTSREAFDVFGLVATEAMRMSLGRTVKPAIPNLAAVDARAEEERARLPRREVQLRDFWRHYLVGRDSRFGFQLLTATWAYRLFMEAQIKALELRDGDRVLDLGAGTGELALQLGISRGAPRNITIDAVDYVGDALRRGRTRLSALAGNPGIRIRPILADLDLHKTRSLPVRSEGYDAALASLIVSYLADPREFLQRTFAALRPGGRLVLSTLRKDADISRLHVEGLEELRAGRAREVLGEDAAQSIDDLARSFLNDAAKILDFEEEGIFHFWDAEELSVIAQESGFRVLKTCPALGNPAQAIVLVGCRE
jgi:ubiquinone/menaquinone biosynthesis C-methylase UbiE